MSDDDNKPNFRQLRILRRMREGSRLAEGKSKYAVALLDDYVEVDLKVVAKLEDRGWIYVIDETMGKRVWGLTHRGLELLASRDA